MSLPRHGAANEVQSSLDGTTLPAPKQIRFVSVEGQPHAKRRRINAACSTCRRRKTRCSGERPECKTCTGNGHVCAGYTDKGARRDIDTSNNVEDEVESGGPTPRSHKPAIQAPQYAPRPTQTLQNEGSSASTASTRGGGRDEDFRSPESAHTAASATALRHRVPFFRYFGPTAIVPGFKQMVVQVKDRDSRRSAHSISGGSPASGQAGDSFSAGQDTSTQEIAFYDATDSAPNPLLITHLCEAFFTHLGCNYPFLQRERFMKDLEEKRVDAILVDAVCAIAARFSNDPALSRPSEQSTPTDEKGEVRRAFKGQPYAQRAHSTLVDTFGCPTIAVVQACLLLAFEEFGTDRDSGLWMFLGTSIRMSQDLGIQKLEGMQLEGRLGPTPKTVKAAADEGRLEEKRREAQQAHLTQALMQKCDENVEDRRASEQERVDTFWAVFFLDRAVSSGVGRPVTLRDEDIELSFPQRPDEKMVDGYPHPFPVLIRIIHLYGRIADVINNIQGSSQVNADGLKQLTAMEKDLTGIYQRLSPKLYFNATNFQHYVKAEQGTNFILLHFWFHTSIILLHQPTLLYSLETSIQQLFPDSRELSMSSAKTIADILAFAELIDVKSFIGNPFTSQPMYVAACAFLAEARAHASQPSSRQHSPPEKSANVKPELSRNGNVKTVMDSKAAAKHSLLATAANQNYQRCYKALKMLDHYWAGTRYILTALDQKSKGLMDPILFTQEDIDGEMPSVEPSFTQPGWRRSSHGRSPADRRTSIAWSPRMDGSQAIGWSLTGTANSPAPNLSFLYPNMGLDGEENGHLQFQAKQQQPLLFRHHQPSRTEVRTLDNTNDIAMMPPPSRSRVGALPYDPVSAADADLLLGLNSPYPVSSGLPQAPHGQQPATSAFDYATAQPQMQDQHSPQYFTYSTAEDAAAAVQSDMFIESQHVDMSNQFQDDMSLNSLSFPGGDMIWLEYLPQDVLNYFIQTGDPSQIVMPPTGPGPPPPSGRS